jgi:hypothetical protein
MGQLVRYSSPVMLWVLVGLTLFGCAGSESGGASSQEEEQSKETATAGQVTVLYEDEAIKPENRDAAEQLRQSSVLERIADWSNERLAMP